jgi:DUF438 domain-containing protein
VSKSIDNSTFKEAKSKELVLKLHTGESQDSVRQELVKTLGTIPYGEVVEVEQDLLEEALPQEELLKLCDVHSAVLEGNVDLSSAQSIPDGHPVDILIQENQALIAVIEQASARLAALAMIDEARLQATIFDLIALFNQLIDVDKHYLRKEYLLFPYLEQTGVTGPQPALKGVADMIVKEEEILFPMLMDALPDADWYEILQQSLEIGYCLYDPPTEWRPPG